MMGENGKWDWRVADNLINNQKTKTKKKGLS
jgi:hypothetical protein